MQIIRDLAIGSDGGHWFGGHDTRRKWLILHGTAGFTTAAQVAAFFRTGPHSTHYVIGQDGEIRQCVDEANSAWANAPTETGCDAWWNQFQNPNMVTLSIEHVKPHTDNSDVLTPAQQASSFALVKDICVRNGIPMRRADANGGIIGHFSIDPISRARCPGPYPWEALWAYLKDTPMQLPSGWHDNGDTLSIDGCPFVFRGGIAEQVKNGLLSGWISSVDIPLENERASADRIEQFSAYHKFVYTKDSSGSWTFFYGNIGADAKQSEATIGGLNSQITGLSASLQSAQEALAQAQEANTKLTDELAAAQALDITEAQKQAIVAAKAVLQPASDALAGLTKAGL